MSVLVEALCLVIPRRALDVSWPGGADAFLRAMCAEGCPSRRVMSDASLESISFFTPEDAEVVAAQLRDLGLLEVVDDRFQDFAFVDQRYGPTMPCPWLHWKRHPDGFSYAWLEGSDSAMMAAPADWEPEQSRRLVREDLRDDSERMFKLAEEDGFEVWLDFATGELSRALARPRDPDPPVE